MIITKFYNIINEELLAILEENSSDERTKQHKDKAQNLGYALLVWFIKFYGQKDLYQSYITDGKDDNSCDVIFSNKNVQGEAIFYVVQSKYVHFDDKKKKEDAFPQVKKEEFGSTLNDFSVILSGKRTLGKNESFNEKYKDLKKHLDNNGKVKFLFFTLAKINEEVADSITAFNKNYAPNINLEVIDIDRIRRDYIEFKYKEITTSNPLEYNYNSEDSTIELPIERINDSNRDIFEFEGRAKAFTFLLKPQTIHELFKKYRFSLFFKNVRNPIHRSNYNEKIIDTLLRKPDSFWYFNNGITAITKILPDVGVHAKKIELEGLQIINGAQTVYSIYSAYENATPIQRKTMDAYAKISLRLIGSSDEEFNLQITRYTNMQNPMHHRDFWANDEVQQALQKESFGTNLWYEKRRDEFQLTKEQQDKLGITVISNNEFALAYVAFHLQKPSYAILRQDDFFISRKDDKDGLYEDIFEQGKVKFEDMFASFFVFNILIKFLLSPDGLANNKMSIVANLKAEADSYLFLRFSALILAMTKIIMEKYFALTKPNSEGKAMNISRYLCQVSYKNKGEDFKEVEKIAFYSVMLFLEKIEDKINSINVVENINRILTSSTFYDILSEKVQEEELNIEAIQAIDLSKKMDMN